MAARGNPTIRHTSGRPACLPRTDGALFGPAGTPWGHATRGPRDGQVPEEEGMLTPAPMITCSQAEEPLPGYPHLPRILRSRKGQEPEPAIGWLLLEGLWGELHLQETHRPQREDLSCLARAHPALEGESRLPCSGGLWPRQGPLPPLSLKGS